MKLSSILLIVFLLLQNCGYKPIFTNNKNIDFHIDKIEFINSDNDLTRFVKSNLFGYTKKNTKNKIKITSSLDYKKIILSKNASGKTTQYNILVKATFNVVSDKKNEVFVFNETSKIKNLDDEYEERNYEKSVKQNIAQLISSKLLTQLSRLYAD